MPQPGEVLLCRDWLFEDESKADKRFVILSAADIDDCCLLLKTTSQSKWYEGAVKGCNKDRRVFFIPSGWQPKCFKLDTYVQLPQIIEIPAAQLIQDFVNKRMYTIDAVSPDCFNMLKNCLKNFRDDIANKHWSILFKSKKKTGERAT